VLGPVEYARCGDLSVAYRFIGDRSSGPDLLISPSFVGHLDMYWSSEVVKQWLSGLASFSRVILFDKAGTGLSDPVPQVATIEQRTTEILAVMEAAGTERPVVAGLSEGASAAIALAALHPDRVRSLIIYGGFPFTFGLHWADREIPSLSEMIDQVARSGIPQEFHPSESQLARMHNFIDAVTNEWGSGRALSELMPHGGTAPELSIMERCAASPGMARATLQAAFTVDVRPFLAAVHCPTLIIHARDDIVPVQGARYVSTQIPRARLVEVDGSDHAPWISDPDRTKAEVERFVTGRQAAENLTRRVTTIVFTDIVNSTEQAAKAGDEAWRLLLQRHDATCERVISSGGGQVLKSMGDGVLATFAGPAAAIHATVELIGQLAEAGIETRAGIHTGECEHVAPTGDTPGDVRGMAVNIGARIAALADAGQVLVSRTVADLVVGSGLGFDDHGVHTLKGVPGEWPVLAVRPDGPAHGAPERTIRDIATPHASTNMRRRDRLALGVMRRAPGVMRAVERATGRIRPRPQRP
jgi:pimeloyl-ACP methyl ester carboxylesterase